ncbi:MAG TPA: aryl-sulfate sulfotransferase [bacterium]|nr:aryl-sulfate sulfotransferase [bacterium]
MARKSLFVLLLLVLGHQSLFGQPRTVGLFLNDTTQAYKGYTLFYPKLYKSTYLINNEGRLVHKWSRSTYAPGQAVFILSNGNLLRTCSVVNDSVNTGGGEGGRVEEYTWDDSLVWQFDYSTSTYMTHHDIRQLPNGNIIMIACEKKTIPEVIQAGFDTSKFSAEFYQNGYLLPDYVIEVQPTFPSGGNIVWAWHVWDHLIQDFDSTKSNYGVVSSHPELISCDAPGGSGTLACFWNHMNAIYYNAKFDQICLSVRGNSEVWVIDHSTTTVQAAGHSGGKYGHGGDLLYRWGNPAEYKLGNQSNEMLFQQHDAHWVDSGCPGAGDMLCFNNGEGRNYSSIDQFTPPVDTAGVYHRGSGQAFGPTALSWTFVYTPPESMFAQDISSAQREPNGNTLICNGPLGRFFEVTSAGTIVWKYVNPVVQNGPLHYNDSIPHDPHKSDQLQNDEFRVQRYAPTYAAFNGKDLTPGDPVELGGFAVAEPASTLVPASARFLAGPSAFRDNATIAFSLPEAAEVELAVYDCRGALVTVLGRGPLSAGSHRFAWHAGSSPNGVYVCRLRTGTVTLSEKLLKLD